MNSVLQVKLRFSSEKNTQKNVGRNLRANRTTSISLIDSLINDLLRVVNFYEVGEKYVKDILIDVCYNDIVAKSNRIQELFKTNKKSANETIVGARFSNALENEENHIITHYLEKNTVLSAIANLRIARQFLFEQLGGEATSKNFDDKINTINYEGYGISKTKLRNLIVDCSMIESFSIPSIENYAELDNFLLTFYKTEVTVLDLLAKLNIDRYKYPYTFYGDNTISASKDLLEILQVKVPYMISMISSDLSKTVLKETEKKLNVDYLDIPTPSTEPTIGVIDTLFDNSVYFSQWVTNKDYLDFYEEMTLRKDADREHGTQVTSIIVDGPRLNPWLDDGCGRFKVRHFGVCEDRIQIPKLTRKIKEIVENNPDIHVWNLSLGTDEEVSKNFISYDSSVLDELQAKRNVIFVISGTNDNRNERPNTLKIGSPADSLNSIVVNSVKRDGTPASYSRKGNVLSFFNKPDVSYYGGDYDERIYAYSPYSGIDAVFGTSFAAPWISRKLCYLIDIMGLSREVAKALIIDAAAGWEHKIDTFKQRDIIGYGIVPININKILETDSEEIKFFVYGTSESYKTTNYAIPVPRDEDGNYPYIARATLCYFPECTRSQGVDYTNRELSLQFGRIKSNGLIDDINENTQDEIGSYIDERQSRKEHRKWDNTKFISKIKKKNRPLKSYDERLWGFAVTSKGRLDNKIKQSLNFGAVITLKEVKGRNRIQDFIKACQLRSWIVTPIEVQNRLAFYNTSQEEILLE